MSWKWVDVVVHCRVLKTQTVDDQQARNQAEIEVVDLICQADDCDPVCSVFDAKAMATTITPVTLEDIYTRIDEGLRNATDAELDGYVEELANEVRRLRKAAKE